MMRILVNGAGGPAGVNTIRSINELKNVELFVTDADSTAVGFFLVKRKRAFTVPFADDKNFCKTYRKIIQENKIDWIISTVDEESIKLKEDEFLKEIVCCSRLDVLKICRDKQKTYSALEGVIPIPWWNSLNEAVIDKSIDGKKTFFVKPVSGRGSRHSFEVKGEDLKFVKKMFDGLDLEGVVCENLSGLEYTVDCLGFGGKIIAIVPRVRLKVSGGLSMKGRTERNSTLINYCRRIYEHLGMHGPACIQFKKSKNGVFKLIEINPRFSGGLEIVKLSGVDLPKILVKLLSGGFPRKNELKWKSTLVGRYATGVVLK